MAKENKDGKVEKDPRQELWEAFLERYKGQNPEKYQQRLDAKELNKIPDSFKG